MKYSKLGYKRYSPDLYKKYNIIPSGRITMKDVDFPVFGTDNLGNQQMMYPGQEYQFPGNQVFELPMAQAGFQYNGNWRDVAPRPDISERRDATRVAPPVVVPQRVVNDRLHIDRANQPDAGTISQYEEVSTPVKVLNSLAHPIEAGSYLARGLPVPDGIGQNPTVMDMALDIVNPFAWANYGRKAFNDLSEGNFTGAASNALGALPAVGFASKASKSIPGVLNEFNLYNKAMAARTFDAEALAAYNSGDKQLFKSLYGEFTPAEMNTLVPADYNRGLLSPPSKVYRSVYNPMQKSKRWRSQRADALSYIDKPITSTRLAREKATELIPEKVYAHGSNFNVGLSTLTNKADALNLAGKRTTGAEYYLDDVILEGNPTDHWLYHFKVDPNVNVLNTEDYTRFDNLINKRAYSSQLSGLEKQAEKARLLKSRGYDAVKKWVNSPELQFLNPSESLRLSKLKKLTPEDTQVHQVGGELPMAQRGGNVVDDEIFFPMMKSIASGMDVAGDWLNNTLEDASVAFKRNMYSSPYAPMMAAFDAGAAPWLFQNVRPVAYPGIWTGVTELASGALGLNEPPQRDAQGDYAIGDEAWRRALGLQTTPKYIVPSKYKPTKATDPNAQYYTLNQDVIDPALLIAEAKKRNLQAGQSVVLPSLAPYIKEGFMPRDEFSQVDPLQNFTIGAGQDARGKYISLYDIYDLEGPAAAVTTPFEFYDRFYYQSGGEMIRRADGSYSRRGLWDNIRANKGSGKKPTKEMLEQERKIKKAQAGTQVSPASSGIATSVIRNVVPLPQNASQLVAATITGDTRYGWDDMDPRSRYELMRSVANARTRTGSNKGGTEYIDYSPQVDRDINNLSTSGPNMVIGSMFSPEFSTATTVGRVSYQYDPTTRTYSIYDSYDFSPTSGSGTTYAAVRNAAGRVAPSNGQPNLIARYTDDDYNEYTRKYKNDAFRVPYKSVTDFTDEAAKFLTHPIDYLSDAFSFQHGGRVPRYNRKMYR